TRNGFAQLLFSAKPIFSRARGGVRRQWFSRHARHRAFLVLSEPRREGTTVTPFSALARLLRQYQRRKLLCSFLRQRHGDPQFPFQPFSPPLCSGPARPRLAAPAPDPIRHGVRCPARIGLSLVVASTQFWSLSRARSRFPGID